MRWPLSRATFCPRTCFAAFKRSSESSDADGAAAVAGSLSGVTALPVDLADPASVDGLLSQLGEVAGPVGAPHHERVVPPGRREAVLDHAQQQVDRRQQDLHHRAFGVERGGEGLLDEGTHALVGDAEHLVAGVDEVGRGPLAGPVVAAAVILHPDRPIEGLADSKYRPCPLLVKYVEAGWLGKKAGRGFYDYRGEKPVPTR